MWPADADTMSATSMAAKWWDKIVAAFPRGFAVTMHVPGYQVPTVLVEFRGFQVEMDGFTPVVLAREAPVSSKGFDWRLEGVVENPDGSWHIVTDKTPMTWTPLTDAQYRSVTTYWDRDQAWEM